MANEREKVLEMEKRDVVKVPLDKLPAERKQEYAEDRKEARRLHKLAKEELRHTRNLRKHLRPFEDGYLADAGTFVEFEVVSERPVSGGSDFSRGVRVCPTCGREETGGAGYCEEGNWARRSTDSLEDVEKHIDSIRTGAEEPTLLKRYEDKFGEKLLIKEKARGYDWSREVEDMAAEKPSWFTGEKKEGTPVETAGERTSKQIALANVANIRKLFGSPAAKHPWHSIRCLPITERTQPKNMIVKGTTMIIDAILWFPLLLVRVPIFVILKLKNVVVVKRKK